jgi:hypothetical protein
MGGHGMDGHGMDGHGMDGHGMDGHGMDGHGVDGHGMDGRGSGGHSWDERRWAYEQGRADGMAARRDPARADEDGTGRDYRIGFLDGRLEVFRMHAAVRKIVDET